MLEAALGLGIFFIKAIIIVSSILIVFSFIASLALKQKLNQKNFKLTNLSKDLKENTSRLKKEMLSGKEQKQLEKAEKKELKSQKQFPSQNGNLFVLDFNGDMKASAAEQLKKCITQVISLANKDKDQVLVRLESPGGMVSGYGLAASELSRLREQNIFLTVSVDKVAASGGYLMSCVANEILAAPFAVLGSIGVVAGMPNFNKLLKKHDIDYELITAGKHKRTLTMLGENTEEGRQKFKGQLEQIHSLFKNYVSKYRPQLDIESVATGDYWFGEDALNLKLADKIQTSEDFILNQSHKKTVYHLEYKEKMGLKEKIMEAAALKIFKTPTDFI